MGKHREQRDYAAEVKQYGCKEGYGCGGGISRCVCAMIEDAAKDIARIRAERDEARRSLKRFGDECIRLWIKWLGEGYNANEPIYAIHDLGLDARAALRELDAPDRVETPSRP